MDGEAVAAEEEVEVLVAEVAMEAAVVATEVAATEVADRDMVEVDMEAVEAAMEAVATEVVAKDMAVEDMEAVEVAMEEVAAVVTTINATLTCVLFSVLYSGPEDICSTIVVYV